MQETTNTASAPEALPIEAYEDDAMLRTSFADDDGMGRCSTACGCAASFPAPNAQEKEPADMADWMFSIEDAWVVLPPRIDAVFDSEDENIDFEAAVRAVQREASGWLDTDREQAAEVDATLLNTVFDGEEWHDDWKASLREDDALYIAALQREVESIGDTKRDFVPTMFRF